MINLDQQYKEAVSMYNAGKHTVAVNRLYKLARLGHAWSMEALGRLCENTVGDDRYWHRQAAFWFHQAAKRGDADAAYHLFRLCHLGKGVRQDDVQALRWLLASAKRGGTSVNEKELQNIKKALNNENTGSLELPI